MEVETTPAGPRLGPNCCLFPSQRPETHLAISGAPGEGDTGTRSGTPGPHKQKAAGSAAGEKHVTGTQLALWPQALGRTSNSGRQKGLAPHPNSPQPSTKCSQSLKFSFNPNSKAWILMVTFQAQGWGGWSVSNSPIRVCKPALRAPFLSRSQKDFQTQSGLLLGKNLGLSEGLSLRNWPRRR